MILRERVWQNAPTSSRSGRSVFRGGDNSGSYPQPCYLSTDCAKPLALLAIRRRMVSMFEDDLLVSSGVEIGGLVVDDSAMLDGGLESANEAEPVGGAPSDVDPDGAPGSSSSSGPGAVPGVEQGVERGGKPGFEPGVEVAMAELAPFGPLSPFGQAGAAILNELSGEGLLDLLAAWDVIEAQASAGKRAVAAALEERLAPRIVTGRQGRVEVKGQAACEVAIRLGVSQQRAGVLVGEGLLFNGILADVGQALVGGLIDAGKAGLFAEALGDQEAAVAFAVIDTLLPKAPSTTHAQLKKALNAEVIRVDPVVKRPRFDAASF